MSGLGIFLVGIIVIWLIFSIGWVVRIVRMKKLERRDRDLRSYVFNDPNFKKLYLESLKTDTGDKKQ